MEKDREKVKADDNYAGLYKEAYHGLKDVITDFMGLYLELQQTDLEDTRVSTRIADRFQNLSCANEKNGYLRERVNALKPFMHTTTKNPAQYTNKKVTKHQLETLKREFGSNPEIVELEEKLAEVSTKDILTSDDK
jgi:hypothetical protein|tara:strand:- start:809 stop:1216 length:408 start_codon:yes stop_codon:yes gene_type:complete